MTEQSRGSKKDLVLAPNEYAYIQDLTNGNVTVCVGSLKSSLEEADQPVVFDYTSKSFNNSDIERAKKLFSTAPEGWYIILKNPAEDLKGPTGGRKESTLPPLKIGRKINIPGPVSHALWPGQMAKIVKGHHLRSNQYLVVRVYDEESAKQFYKEAIITPQKDEDTPKVKVEKLPDLTMGNLMIIKGTEVSFYIPPTGIEVIPERKNGNLIREAVTLELLEYCILLDENGNKRYIKGPDVVFPRPTEQFMKGPQGSRKFKAIELNEISGLYIKVTADYDDYLSGDELFITGKDQMIYFPREEHTIIKYGDKEKHHAVAIPRGEARYVMNRMSGEIKLVMGPAMLLPDPRKEVIIRRVLPEKYVQLWYPGNTEAEKYNQNLRSLSADYVSEDKVSAEPRTLSYTAGGQETAEHFINDSISRGIEFTEPRTITLDTKYDGVPKIEPWTGYAIMVVNAKGDRRVVVGPSTVLLDYDEYLESFEFSTGTPKTSEEPIKSSYLRVLNNRISDVVTAETRDLCEVDIHISYRVNFTGKPKNWFSVENYVQHLCDHMRSFIRNIVKGYEIEKFYESNISILRDAILGVKPEDVDGRPGRLLEENGMQIYDVEVLDVSIEDEEISQLLIDNQIGVVRQTLNIVQMGRDAELVVRKEEIERVKDDAIHESKMTTLDRKEAASEKSFSVAMVEENNSKELIKQQSETNKSKHDIHDETANRERDRKKSDNNQHLEFRGAINELALALETNKSDQFVRKADSVNPQLIAALTSLGQGDLMARISESIGPLAILGKKPIAEIIKNVLSGSSIDASVIKELHFDVDKLKKLVE